MLHKQLAAFMAQPFDLLSDGLTRIKVGSQDMLKYGQLQTMLHVQLRL